MWFKKYIAELDKKVFSACCFVIWYARVCVFESCAMIRKKS